MLMFFLTSICNSEVNLNCMLYAGMTIVLTSENIVLFVVILVRLV